MAAQNNKHSHESALTLNSSRLPFSFDKSPPYGYAYAIPPVFWRFRPPIHWEQFPDSCTLMQKGSMPFEVRVFRLTKSQSRLELPTPLPPPPPQISSQTLEPQAQAYTLRGGGEGKCTISKTVKGKAKSSDTFLYQRCRASPDWNCNYLQIAWINT